MDNMEKLVKKYINNLLRKEQHKKQTCNCRTNNNTSPLHCKCLSSSIVYSAEVLIGNIKQGDKYFDIRKTEFKIRLGDHKNSFTNRQKKRHWTF